MHPLEGRNPATANLLRFFAYDHLPPHLQAVSAPVCDLAFDMATTLPDSAELTVALRKLLESKDALVRCALVAQQDAQARAGQTAEYAVGVAQVPTS